MKKTTTKLQDYWAYVNPTPSMTEAMQREVIVAVGPIAEWYVESRTVTRENFIQHLREGSVAVVAWTANLAQMKGGKMHRIADLMDARGEIHARGAVLLEASTGLRSAIEWPEMKTTAIPVLGRLAQGAKSAMNGTKGQPPLAYTDAERKIMRRIAESRLYKNWPDREAAIEDEGMKVPSRSWFYAHIVSTIGLAKQESDLGRKENCLRARDRFGRKSACILYARQRR